MQFPQRIRILPRRWLNLRAAGIAVITKFTWHAPTYSLRNAPYIVAQLAYTRPINGIITMEYLTKRGTTFRRRLDIITRRMTR